MNTEHMSRDFSRCDNGQSIIYMTSSMYGKHDGGLSFYVLSDDTKGEHVFHFTPWEAKAFVKRVNREWEWAKAKGDLENKRRPRNMETLFPTNKEKKAKS